MNEVVRERIDKAEGDYLTATREAQAAPPNYDAACFHAQQCIEKLLKAALIAHGAIPTKTPDLTILSVILVPWIPTGNGLWKSFACCRVPRSSSAIPASRRAGRRPRRY